MNPFAAIGSLFRFDFEAILSDPTQLGIFLELAETIAELEPRAREVAISSPWLAKRSLDGVWCGARAIASSTVLTSGSYSWNARLSNYR